MSAVGLRARKKERTRDELTAAALALFVDKGFDGTTVEEIAAAVDVSPRTFFRYFRTKEDVLFGDDSEGGSQRVHVVMAGLREHPGGVAPDRLLREVLVALAASYECELPTLLLRKRVISATPALRSRAVERRETWEATVVEELSERFGHDADTKLGLRVTVAATTAALHVALDIWLESDGRRDLRELIERAFDHLAVGLNRPAHQSSRTTRSPRGGGR